VIALTLTQPWATLVAIGEKRVETRSWGTKYRGPLAIHAAKGFPKWAREVCRTEPFERVLWIAGYRLFEDLPLGVVIATAHLDDCLPITTAPNGEACVAPDDEGLIRPWSRLQMFGAHAKVQVGYTTTEHEAAFGDYTPGRFGWLLSKIAPLPHPVPARGTLGLWKLSDQLEQQVRNPKP
jgi:activating signal cointegrator 1